jgi:hypothetical protein
MNINISVRIYLDLNDEEGCINNWHHWTRWLLFGGTFVGKGI